MKSYFHSVVLDKYMCRGCTTCVKGCPTQAIRVRKGKAGIIQEKCIDCGECIRICPHYAKNAITDSLINIKKYKYNVVLVPPAMIAQFKTSIRVNQILSAIKRLGFNEVIEVAYSAEILGEAIKLEVKRNNYPKPAIPVTCPGVVELIQVRFPELIPNLVKLETPNEVMAKLTLERLIDEKGFTRDEIGISYITPCASKAARVHDKNSYITDAISMKEIFPEILEELKNVANEESLQITQRAGQFYTNSTVESTVLNVTNSISVDGIKDVIKVLEKIDRGSLDDIEFFVGFACVGGCSGGCLTIENPFIANKRLTDRDLANNMKKEIEQEFIENIYNKGLLHIKEEILPRTIQPLDSDLKTAINMMKKIDEIEELLPGLDCGSCGAPCCKALSEDIVRGYAKLEACIFLFKEAISSDEIRLQNEFTHKIIPISNKSDGEKNGEYKQIN